MSGTTREAVQKFKDKRRQPAEQQISKPRPAKKTKGRKRFKIQCRYEAPFFRKDFGVWWTCGRYLTEEHMNDAFREYTKRGTVYGSLRCDFRCVLPDGSFKFKL